ncbi:hypothetical protein BGX21_008325 [Mortierella sp. AD011]|nr:hypothetical protein BGX20_008368 [Mortierella sp. AD010]KAF9397954.1 hypothetical protein BGX21_008325 [Mortierella sp. AD011]
MDNFPEVSSLRITPRATPITNPLDLPEIQLRIVGFLERKDLARCLLVSKAWYKLLLPLVWKETVAISSELRITPYGLMPENLKRHSEHIQILGIHDNIPGQFTATYPKLHALTLGPGNPPENKSFPGGDLTDLIELNPSLVLINISSLDHYLQAPFWNAVADLPHLETIQIRDATINNEDDAKAFWLSCQNMENLCLTYISFIVRDDIITQLNLTKMRSLELDFVKDMDDMTSHAIALDRFPSKRVGGTSKQ